MRADGHCACASGRLDPASEWRPETVPWPAVGVLQGRNDSAFIGPAPKTSRTIPRRLGGSGEGRENTSRRSVSSVSEPRTATACGCANSGAPATAETGQVPYGLGGRMASVSRGSARAQSVPARAHQQAPDPMLMPPTYPQLVLTDCCFDDGCKTELEKWHSNCYKGDVYDIHAVPDEDGGCTWRATCAKAPGQKQVETDLCTPICSERKRPDAWPPDGPVDVLPEEDVDSDDPCLPECKWPAHVRAWAESYEKANCCDSPRHPQYVGPLHCCDLSWYGRTFLPPRARGVLTVSFTALSAASSSRRGRQQIRHAFRLGWDVLCKNWDIVSFVACTLDPSEEQSLAICLLDFLRGGYGVTVDTEPCRSFSGPIVPDSPYCPAFSGGSTTDAGEIRFWMNPCYCTIEGWRTGPDGFTKACEGGSADEHMHGNPVVAVVNARKAGRDLTCSTTYLAMTMLHELLHVCGAGPDTGEEVDTRECLLGYAGGSLFLAAMADRDPRVAACAFALDPMWRPPCPP